MALTTQIRSARSKAIIQLAQASEKESFVSRLAGRLIQITLALYLLPALLGVLVVGGIGIFILKFSQLLTTPTEGSLK
jgi:hypothetical protein